MLTLSTLGYIFSRQHIELLFLCLWFFLFQQIVFDISDKLETICIKCQACFWESIRKKNIINVSSAKFAKRVVKVNIMHGHEAIHTILTLN